MHVATPNFIRGAERAAILVDTFGKDVVKFEQTCFRMMELQAKGYTGGYWEFVKVPGSVYMHPTGYEEGFDYNVPSNWFSGHVSQEAAGIIVSLYSLNQLCWLHHDVEKYTEMFHALRDFAATHDEASAIFGAID